MRIIAIDPGYERLGIAVVEKIGSAKETVIHSDCFMTSSKEAFYDRIRKVGAEIEKIIETHKPEAMAIEKLFFSKNQKTAMLVSEARGVIIYEAKRHNLPVYEYSPAEIKIAVTSHGKSDKQQIIAMIPKLVVISKVIKHDDEYDAIAVGLTCLAHNRGLR